MTKKHSIILLAFSFVILMIAVMIIIPLYQYIDTYEPWYSFLTREVSIAVLVVTIITALFAIITIVVLTIKMIKK
ncbi:MAG: hypothetical protein PHZ28_05960 [Candidatus Izemoplasmatales bacterium]|nr:hypothetical protein [Candidatus Izemoplasmatales bacterium]